MFKSAVSGSAPHRSLRISSQLIVWCVVLVSLIVVTATTYRLYRQMQLVFRQNVEERLMAIATVASTQFSPEDLDRITGPESVAAPIYAGTVLALQRIRRRTPDIRFLYILRATNDPSSMEFVADADSLHPDLPVDLNEDGVIDDADALVFPGETYDVSGLAEFRAAAFVRPYVDPEFISDQWGTLVGGTAPIFSTERPNGPTNYLVGVDLNISDYDELLQRMFVPFAAFVMLLLVVILAQVFTLRRLWQTQVRQLREIDRQKDELLSIVSHQLAAPITSLRWRLENLADGDCGPLTVEQQDQIKTMLRSTVGLADLVNILLELSRVELGRLTVLRAPVALDEFFDDLQQGIEAPAKEKGVLLTVERPTQLPIASIDRRLTRMTLENLLNNAVKYTPTGGRVKVTVERAGNLLHCRIADTGCGIPRDELPHLFTKLYRATNVRDSVPGNGFGLYIAKGAIEQQGGTIACQSEVGVGTTFDVELPIVEGLQTKVAN